MAKNKPNMNEYIPEWDGGTYQTGAIKEPKGSSNLVACLLLLVIFLVGACSVLGILNIRLLARLARQEGETVSMAIDSHVPTTQNDHLLDQLDAPKPSIPAQPKMAMNILDAPYCNPNAPALSGQQVLEENRNSLVQIQCLTTLNSTESGIGLVLSTDGYILTNSHLVDTSKRIFVTLPDGSLVRAALVGRDQFSDLAVLYVDAEGLVPATFSSNQNLQVNDLTYAFETGDEPVMIRQSNVFTINRILSAKSASLRLIQTCSGGTTGPVFDSMGHVIGFQVGNISNYFPNADTKGVGLVVPTSTIQLILKDLLKDGCVEGRPSLRMEVEAISKIYQQYWQLPGGLLLTTVTEDSDAAAKGLLKGDILLALDGKPVHGPSELYAILYNLNVGDSVIAVVRRDGQTFTVELTIQDTAQQ